MGLTPDVAPRQTIASAWGNEIRDRTLQVFANEAERTAQWPNPPDGSHSILLSEPWMIWRRVGGAWKAQDIQAERSLITTNASGGFTVTFPHAFRGVPQGVAITASGSSTVFRIVAIIDAQRLATSIGGVVRDIAGGVTSNQTLAIYWVAVYTI